HNNLKKIEQDIVNNNQSLNSCLQKIELWQQQIQSINQLLAKLEDQQQTLLVEKKEIEHILTNSTDNFTKDREVLLRLQETFNTAELEYSSNQTELNKLQLDTEKQQSKVNSMKQELDYKSSQNAQSELQLKEFESDQIRLIEQEQNDKIKLQELETSLANQIVVKDEFSKKVVSLETSFQQQKVQQFKNQDLLKSIQKDKQQIESELFEVNNQYNDLKLNLAGVSERLKIEFNTDLNSLVLQHIEVENTLEFLQDKVEKIKKRIDNIGEVNPTAIEAFNEMKIRYDFIAKQKEDLVNAKLSLLQTIKEVEESANNLFLDTFTKVRSHFQEVFKVLFTPEDTADLILTNSNNLAETAIEIVAKPKGKRPSSINQLSGGEKTLTATALLFSIYLIKPAPFCIFDEVDAPLDDVNVEKFSKLIRKFSENSQFIIVTHNKQTMNNVDVIYGVTMQEVGVSKIVPVDFRNLE
ncbi:MAG: chromosome segregation protein SMC, partial [Sediminibacterium sp.]|nr:chromosome segregation protein SMC [Sediminibacterium sp.]